MPKYYYNQIKQIFVTKMHTKSLSLTTTGTSHINSFRAPSKQAFNEIEIENKLLKQELQRSREETIKMKQEMLRIYEQNIQLRDRLASSEESTFVEECQEEIERLKSMINKLMDTKHMGSSEREEIKDRIIMKLEDEVIALKIELKESKLKKIRKAESSPYVMESDQWL